MVYKEFDQIRLDAFKEITSIATGNAATSLSVMLGKRVDITVPSIVVEDVLNIPALIGEREKKVTVLNFTVSGQFRGNIMLLFSPSECLRLINMLTGQSVDNIVNLNEMELSAIKELGNIVTGSYIRVLAEGLGVRTKYSVPAFAYDMLGAVFDEIMASLSSETEHAVVMESEFMVRHEVYRGYLIFILTPNAVKVLIKALAA
jgi:chemotaxis protein CheC